MQEHDNFEIKKLDKHIYIVKNAISCTDCENIIEYINSNECEDTDNNIVRAFVRRLQSNNKDDVYINKKISNICKKIFHFIMHVNPLIEINGDISYHLRKIYDNTSLHTDEVPATVDNFIDNKIRTISLIINLNDNYSGGIFHFPKQNISYKMNKGEAILFPPFWTHPHEISSVSSYRYTITTWGTEKIIKT